MTVILGLSAAILYGIADFAGGFASRRVGAVTVLLYSYPVGAVLMTAMLPFFGGHLSVRVALFGVCGGLAGLTGVLVMYQLMVSAPLNVISPVTAVLAAVVPVFVGVAIGERPAVAAWIGIALGIVAVLLVSRTSESNPHGRVGLQVLGLACVSGLGFGLYFVFLARAGHDSGLWPLVVSRFTSAIAILPLAMRFRAFKAVTRPNFGIVLVVGACDALANLFFLLASHVGLLALASVLTALYPAVTVLLAVLVLREHTSRVQRAGLALAAGAVVLITI